MNSSGQRNSIVTLEGQMKCMSVVAKLDVIGCRKVCSWTFYVTGK